MRLLFAVAVTYGLAACAFNGSNSAGSGNPDASSGDASTEVPDATADRSDAVSGDAANPLGLSDDGIVARYFVDDATSGVGQTVLSDSVSPALDLVIDFDESASFVTVGGHVGIEFTDDVGEASAAIGLQGSKIRVALDQATTATIEMVVDVTDPDLDSRLFHVGIGEERGLLALQVESSGALAFVFNDTERFHWNVNLHAMGRVALHLVLDTSQPVEADRVKLYIGGTLISGGIRFAPTIENETIKVPDDKDVELFLGNRDGGDRGWVGIMYYSALYFSAMSSDVVRDNATVLLAHDDT